MAATSRTMGDAVEMAAPDHRPPGARCGAATAQAPGDLLVDERTARELRREALRLPSWVVTGPQLCDLELLLNGAFHPLTGFLGREDYESVCTSMRLRDGTLWPIPIMLDVPREFASSLSSGDRVALRHPEGSVLAVLTVSEVWAPDRLREALLVLGTSHEDHPGAARLLEHTHPVYVGGALEGLELPPHAEFTQLRHTPRQLRARFRELGWTRIVAFQTRNPMHRAHVELTKRAAAEADAGLLIHPAVGTTQPGDIDAHVRVRCYRAALGYYERGTAVLSLLPLAMRMAGPRAAVWHAIIRRNYGCTHFIVGRDHAGPRRRDTGEPFYPPYAAQAAAQEHEAEMGIRILPFEELVYAPDLGRYVPRSEAAPATPVLTLSGTELRRRLRAGLEIPAWFTYPEVARELREAYPPPRQQGFAVFLTGLPASGKSTIATRLMDRLMEITRRPVTLLDGDVARRLLSTELGFSRRDRDLNIQRIGFVATEVVRHRGIVVCAAIAPYRAARRKVRDAVAAYGGFVEVHVATPLGVCESRDRKGLYAAARAALVAHVTGIDDPYEPPEAPEVVVDTSSASAAEATEQILRHLEQQGFIDGRGPRPTRSGAAGG
jgi:sulfate adenylyltransferase